VKEYNPRYFDNPEEYRPSRWYGVSNESEAFTAFSIGQSTPNSFPSSNTHSIDRVANGAVGRFIGPRTCIGRKFATTEAVCFLTMLLREYRVRPTLQGKETREAWRERVVDAKVLLTLGIKDVPVTFVRRG
jgi:cytochrome P450